MSPKVTVLCFAYNQEQFIRNVLNGFIMQKTDFPFEVLVHDDASTDKTPDIIREYAEKYPNIIIPILSKTNHFQAGLSITNVEFCPRIRGKYVAHCDGDDWWTDDHKLQKQVDFLDANPDFSICATQATIVWSDNSHIPVICPSDKFLKTRHVQTFDDLVKENFIVNSTVMYRWNYTPSDLPHENIMPSDWFFHLLHARYGKIKTLAEPMVVYSRWNGGVWQDGNNDEFFVKNYLKLIQFYKQVEKKFNVDKSTATVQTLLQIISACIKTKNADKIIELYEIFPDMHMKICEFIDAQNRKKHELERKLKHGKQAWYYIVSGLLLIMIISWGL